MMEDKLKGLRSKRRAQLAIGLFIGIGFGFLLQKGGVTRYDVIVGQLLLDDFTIFKDIQKISELALLEDDRIPLAGNLIQNRIDFCDLLRCEALKQGKVCKSL